MRMGSPVSASLVSAAVQVLALAWADDCGKKREMIRVVFFSVVCLSLALNAPILAQPSHYGDTGDNLGTWKWGSASPPQVDDFEEDDYDGTTWEQMYEDRLYEQELEKEDEPAALSLLNAPVKLWRFFWPQKDEDALE